MTTGLAGPLKRLKKGAAYADDAAYADARAARAAYADAAYAAYAAEQKVELLEKGMEILGI